jgi:ankyrin repeat protein
MIDGEAFFAAVKQGDRAQVALLLEEDPSLASAHDKNGVSAVLTAIYYGQPAMAEQLITAGAPLNVFEASAAGKIERVKELVASDANLADAFAPDGFQPLGLACFFGHLDLARFLLEQGASVNSASANDARVMPLHSAAAAQNVAIARLLLAAGADPNAVQTDGFTPLHSAAQNGQLEMIELLLEHGARSDSRTVNGKTPLALAEATGREDAAALLRERGA